MPSLPRNPASRDSSLLCLFLGTSVLVALSGCSTIYSEVYSYRKTSFDWKKEKALMAASEQMAEKAQAARNRKKGDAAEGAAGELGTGSAPLQLDSGLTPAPAGGGGLFGGGLDDMKPAAPSAIPGTGGGVPGMGGSVPGMGGSVPGMGSGVPGMGGGVPGMGGTPGSPDGMKPGGTNPPNMMNP